MQRDIRETPLYQEAETLYRKLRQVGTGLISDATEVHLSSDGSRVVFSGTIVDEIKETLPTRICQTDLETGETHVLTFGPNSDRLPKFSPDGTSIGFLSDRKKAGNFQLYFLDLAIGRVTPAPEVDGWIEYLHWSSDGRHVLLGVAGHGADVTGGQGAVTSKQVEGSLPSWIPILETGDESFRWRSAWLYEVETGMVRQVSKVGCNVWEAVWSGLCTIAAVVSPGPGEEMWYTAKLNLIDIKSGDERVLYTPKDQLGWPSITPSGGHLVVVEAVCSDRGIVAGDLLLVDALSGETEQLNTNGVAVTYTEWCSEERLLFAGHRGPETVIGEYDAVSRSVAEIWASRGVSSGGRYINLTGSKETSDCVFVGESFLHGPEIAVICKGIYQSVKSFDSTYSDMVTEIASVEAVSWKAPDGLEIQGWLMQPKGKGPHPLVMEVHGGPVWHWRPRWLGRYGLHALMLVKHGYAVFWPNPRGSGGQGQEFVRLVYGDMGGADTYDYLSGLDYLVDQGIADPRRLGVTGVSYGGFMTSWLITQDSRFRCAVSVAPVTNWISQHLVSNIPHFDSLFLGGRYNESSGNKYLERSPIMHAHRVSTPTLNICGMLDRCTPPEQAVQFHNALLENGVESALVIYPEEGHGVCKFPAAIDYATRIVAWFEEYMPGSS